MMELVRWDAPVESPAQLLPVEMSVVLEDPVWRLKQVIEGVKRVKETPWYRIMRRKGLRFVPLDCSDSMLMLAVGTDESLGTIYLRYKNAKMRSLPSQPPAVPAFCENRKAS
jgi:hypothetical protein